MDRASDYGSEGWGFESLRARSGPPRCDPPVGVLHFYQALLRECFFHAHPSVAFPAGRFPIRPETKVAQQQACLSGGATELGGYRTKRVGFVVTFRLFGAEKSVLKLVGANLKDGQNVLVL